MTAELVAAARVQAAKIEALWTPFDQGSPTKADYYFVRDCDGRDGVAFMHRNRQWTLIDGGIRKPLVKWRAMS